MRENTHEYPFYKKQDIQLEEMRKKIWTSDKEGRVWLHQIYVYFELTQKDTLILSKYKREWYAETIQAPFENIMIPIPAGD